MPLAETTRVVEFNDVEALRRELAHGDVACVLAEPALTNIGIVLPEPGYHDALRAATRETGTLLIIDETHTLSAGPGGYTQAHGLEPDLLTIGKPLAGGVPAGAYGFSAEVAERVKREITDEVADTGGIGGTLAANVLQFAAMRATLGEVLTDEAFERMIALGERFEAGVQQTIDRHGLPWHVTRLGCRVEYLFHAERARTGAQAAAAGDEGLDRLIHLYALNRGILLTPFHNMALMSPATTEADVDRHTEVFDAAARELTAASRRDGAARVPGARLELERAGRLAEQREAVVADRLLAVGVLLAQVRAGRADGERERLPEVVEVRVLGRGRQRARLRRPRARRRAGARRSRRRARRPAPARPRSPGGPCAPRARTC